MSAVGVCGFGRCGSTMVMQMLDAGGLPPVDGTQPGSYELPGIDIVYQRGPAYFEGRAVKLLDAPLRFGAPLASSWQFVWLDRDRMEQAKSQVKFFDLIVGERLPPEAVGIFADSYAVDRPKVLGFLRRTGHVLVLRYEDVLRYPLKAAKHLRKVFPDLDVQAAAAVVHERDGACRPDCAVEFASVSVPAPNAARGGSDE